MSSEKKPFDKLKVKKIEIQLWKIEDTLRGKMSADDFIDYIGIYLL